MDQLTTGSSYVEPTVVHNIVNDKRADLARVAERQHLFGSDLVVRREALLKDG